MGGDIVLSWIGTLSCNGFDFLSKQSPNGWARCLVMDWDCCGEGYLF